MTHLQNIICSLEIARNDLLLISNDPKNYNHFKANSLEILAWDLHRKIQDLKETHYGDLNYDRI